MLLLFGYVHWFLKTKFSVHGYIYLYLLEAPCQINTVYVLIIMNMVNRKSSQSFQPYYLEEVRKKGWIAQNVEHWFHKIYAAIGGYTGSHTLLWSWDITLTIVSVSSNLEAITSSIQAAKNVSNARSFLRSSNYLYGLMMYLHEDLMTLLEWNVLSLRLGKVFPQSCLLEHAMETYLDVFGNYSRPPSVNLPTYSMYHGFANKVPRLYVLRKHCV